MRGAGRGPGPTEASMRRTKIVATIGPACRSPELLAALIGAGADVLRLNFSHASREEHGETIHRVRGLDLPAGRTVAILQDLAGPKVRIGEIKGGSALLESGRELVLTTRRVPGDSGAVSISHPELRAAVHPGDPILLADGTIELRVKATNATDVVAEVVVGGQLASRKGINLPTRSFHASGLTEKDREDLRFGIERGVDLAALSFVRSPEDLESARDLIRSVGTELPLIAKIEKHEALGAIDAILRSSDGIMVARGDLGVEIPLERVPRVQKSLIEQSNDAARPVITATQMLRSMVESPRPTRAEVADVANAVLDGADALMLSEETAVGRYPVEAVAMMARIIEETERDFPHERWLRAKSCGGSADAPEAVAHAACMLAEEIGAAAILGCTRSGRTARLMAKFRPRQPIVAATPSARTARTLAVSWGVACVQVQGGEDLRAISEEAVDAALSIGLLKPGETAVLTAGVPDGEAGSTSLIRVIQA